MSADRTTTEHHLTGHGWVKGTFGAYSYTKEEIPAPPDRIETWNRQTEQASGFALDVSWWEKVWETDQVSEESEDINSPEVSSAHRLRSIRFLISKSSSKEPLEQKKKRRARSSRLLAFPSRGEPASLTEGD
jgi:hypothetical protein